VGRNARGRPKIIDLDLAQREWRKNAGKPPPATKGTSVGVQLAEPSPEASLSEAQRRVAIQRELKLGLENQQKQGVLIDAARERQRDFECARTVRDSILNVPDRVAAELAAETDSARVHRRLEQELRAALATLAEIFDAEPDDDDVPARGGADAA
jgi:hypothetical protein